MVNKFLNIKTFLLLFILISSFSYSESKAQNLYFCEGVDADGYAIESATLFTISSSGGYLYFLCRLPWELESRSVSYAIYKVDNNGYETFFETVYQDTERNWTWFWKKYTFYESGNYNVYVYDGSNNLLTSGSVNIRFKN
ncbi:MAG TPA: hypothetical protein PLG90_07180 [Ignavibacteria bacterium]|nr:hypothetical protein [Ignavibacteria bacterium]